HPRARVAPGDEGYGPHEFPGPRGAGREWPDRRTCMRGQPGARRQRRRGAELQPHVRLRRADGVDVTRPTNSTTLELSGDGLTVGDAECILRGQIETVAVTSAARRNVDKARSVLTDLLASGETIYGVNTGFGKLANQRIEQTEVLALQQNLLRSHAVGMGDL